MQDRISVPGRRNFSAGLVVSSVVSIEPQVVGPEQSWGLSLCVHGGSLGAMAPPKALPEVMILGAHNAKQAIASEAKLRIFIV